MKSRLVGRSFELGPVSARDGVYWHCSDKVAVNYTYLFIASCGKPAVRPERIGLISNFRDTFPCLNLDGLYAEKYN